MQSTDRVRSPPMIRSFHEAIVNHVPAPYASPASCSIHRSSTILSTFIRHLSYAISRACPPYGRRRINEIGMEKQNSVVAWIALILAVIAIILAWVAFNRTGADIEAIVQEQVEQAAAELRVDFETLEQDVRSSTADQLQDAAQEVETDDDDTNNGTQQ